MNVGNPDKANQVVDEIKTADGTAIAVKGGVSDVVDVERLFKEAITAFGSLANGPKGKTSMNSVVSGVSGSSTPRYFGLVEEIILSPIRQK